MRRRTRNIAIPVAAVVMAVITGCGSTVEPTATETIGPVNGGLGLPGTNLPGGTTGTTSATSSTGSGSSSASSGGAAGPGSIPTSGVASSGSASGQQSTGTASSGGTSGPAASKQTGPLTIGFLTTDTSNANQYGASLGNTVSESGVDKALIDALNKKGGLDGRKLKIVFAHTDTGSTNWANDFQAACATFTQDHHVNVVLGYEFTYEPDFETCLAEQNIPHLNDGFNVPSNDVLSQYPGFWSLDVPTIGERNIAKFEGAIKTGFLIPKNKLAVVVDRCPGTVGAWQTEVEPYLKAHQINYVPPFYADCSTGNNAGAASAVSNVENAMVKLRSEGVDRIAFVSVSEAPVLFIATTVAQAQGYYPGWIVSSLGQLAVIGGESPKSEMRNTHGYGWLPSQDVPPQYNPKPNASQKRCIALLHSQNVQPRAAADFGYAYNACEAVFVYERALKLDGGNADGTAISNAVASIGNGFQSTLNLYGRSTLSADRRNNAPAFFKPINWDGNCSCFRYGHQTFPMP
ncbi:MAG TPA: hypothetical protein VG650_16350 [Mycobacteriales bacterium]|nr:hypothetical protein [Mycobacteriales bacterium]